MTEKLPIKIFEQHIVVLGKTRSGKSTVMRGMVERLLDLDKPVCIIDPKGDWWGLKLSKDGKKAGYPIVIFGGEHADVPINAHAGAAVAELFATGNRPCLIDMGGMMVGERTRFYIEFSQALFKLTRGERHLVIDEVHNFAPKGKVFDPEAGKALHWTNRLASEGLGRGIQMIFASQRPQKVHNDTLTSAETLIAMRVLHKADRDAIRDWIMGCGDMNKGAEVLHNLANMERGEGWIWSPEAGIGPKNMKFPMFDTYDSFKPQTAEDRASLKGWATVDLAEVTAKLASVLDEAKKNDPKLLRARVAELEKELGTRATVPATDYKRISDEAFQNGVTLGRAKAISEIKTDLAHLRNSHQAVNQIYEEVESRLEHLCNPPESSQFPPGVLARAAASNMPALVINKIGPVVKMDGRPYAHRIYREKSKLGKAETALLTVMAQFEGQSVTRTKISLLSGYSGRSSTFANTMSALRVAGYIVGSGDDNRITEVGLQALGEFEPRAAGAAAVNWWAAKLGKAPRTFLQLIADRAPGDIPKDELSNLSGYSMSSSTFANALSELRGLELITGRDRLQLSPEFGA